MLFRSAIARALINKPSIILADEPTGNLDSVNSDLVMKELNNLHNKGNTIVMVTHNPDLTVHASRVITMLDGRIDTDTNNVAKPKSVKKPKDKATAKTKKKTASKKKVKK